MTCAMRRTYWRKVRRRHSSDWRGPGIAMLSQKSSGDDMPGSATCCAVAAAMKISPMTCRNRFSCRPGDRSGNCTTRTGSVPGSSAWHQRRGDPLRNAAEHGEYDSVQQGTTSIALDLDRALSTLPEDVRLCIVLAYHERMTHAEIAEFTGIPPGTIKSHIRRGSQKLQEELSAYVSPRETMA